MWLQQQSPQVVVVEEEEEEEEERMLEGYVLQYHNQMEINHLLILI
jgi:hypothetical protein